MFLQMQGSNNDDDNNKNNSHNNYVYLRLISSIYYPYMGGINVLTEDVGARLGFEPLIL